MEIGAWFWDGTESVGEGEGRLEGRTGDTRAEEESRKHLFERGFGNSNLGSTAASQVISESAGFHFNSKKLEIGFVGTCLRSMLQ